MFLPPQFLDTVHLGVRSDKASMSVCCEVMVKPRSEG